MSNELRSANSRTPAAANLATTAKYFASIHRQSGNDDFVAARAFDNDSSTRWHSQAGETQGAWFAAQWDKPVTIRKPVIHAARDRLTDFTIQRLDPTRDDWVDLLHVFANRHHSSYSRTGDKFEWEFHPDIVWVDGKRLSDSRDRAFGEMPQGVHPVFTINLPDPCTTRGMRMQVSKASTNSVGVFEMEILGTPRPTEAGADRAHHIELLVLDNDAVLANGRHKIGIDVFPKRLKAAMRKLIQAGTLAGNMTVQVCSQDDMPYRQVKRVIRICQ